VSVPACATLTRIGINQAPGNGSDYPFVQQSELGWALLDVYLSYADDTCYINAPFYIRMYLTAVSPVPAGTVNIRDKDNAIVFSGTLGAGQAWGTDRLICEMLNDTGVSISAALNCKQQGIAVCNSKTCACNVNIFITCA